jgi:hypothetical protein
MGKPELRKAGDRRKEEEKLTRFNIILQSNIYFNAPRAFPSWSPPCAQKFSKDSKK